MVASNTSATSKETSSSKSTVSTSYIVTSTSSSTTSTKTSQTSTPSCTPKFSLVGASESAFNPQLVPFSVKLLCTLLDVNNYTIFTTGGSNPIYAPGAPIVSTTNTTTSIGLPGFGDGYVNIVIAAMDTSGNAIIQSFQLVFGDISMPVVVLDQNNLPVSGVLVFANATIYPGVSQVGTTDANGLVTFTNLPPTTIGLTARTADNQIGVNGIAATVQSVTLKLLPFGPASSTTDFNVSNGTTGWTGGTNEQLAVSKRDTVLSVSTNGQYTIQMASANPKVYPFTKTVYIKYKFQTNEIPGGFFGTQYNDYYIITIRSDTGGYASVSHSMNELGLGAFDAGGNTDWYTLFLPASTNTKWVEFDVGVSNVVDNLYDSQIIVAALGDLTCQTCGDCSLCPGDPMCQPKCIDPPMQSCDFYTSCSEATLQCGPSGYPIKYGAKNCLKFQANLGLFSPAGQAFIWGTMHCLQVSLVGSTTCDSTCDSLYTAAFASHPGCYIGNGFCTLGAWDWFHVVETVGWDFFQGPTFIQAFQTAGGCVAQLLGTLETEIESLLSQAASDLIHAAVYLAQAAALRVAKAFLQNLINNLGVPQI
jgi:hypothetical protein